MRDIIKSSEEIFFQDKVIVFGGRSETVLTILNSSYLWKHCKVLKLTKNMKLFAGLTDDAVEEFESLSKQILNIEDGK